jgi:hypothetical protein
MINIEDIKLRLTELTDDELNEALMLVRNGVKTFVENSILEKLIIEDYYRRTTYRDRKRLNDLLGL